MISEHAFNYSKPIGADDLKFGFGEPGIVMSIHITMKL